MNERILEQTVVSAGPLQSLTPEETGMSEADQEEAADESEQQLQQSDTDKLKFEQETGISLP